MHCTNKPRPQVPSSMDVCDLGGGSVLPRLHAGGAKNLWVKKNHHTRGDRLKIATYNARTLLTDEYVQELEEELKENNMKWARRSPKKRGKFHNSPKWPPAVSL